MTHPHATAGVTSTADSRPGPTTAARSTVSVDGSDTTHAKVHAGKLTQGDKGRAYALTATNSGTQPSTGALTVAALGDGGQPYLVARPRVARRWARFLFDMRRACSDSARTA